MPGVLGGSRGGDRFLLGEVPLYTATVLALINVAFSPPYPTFSLSRSLPFSLLITASSGEHHVNANGSCTGYTREASHGFRVTGVTREYGHAPSLGRSYAPRPSPTVGPKGGVCP